MLRKSKMKRGKGRGKYEDCERILREREEEVKNEAERKK